MEPGFWHERWQAGQIGFHQARVHAHLDKHAHLLTRLSPTPRVLVPLCGKSLDMRHLRALGYSVVGAELSPIAARDFFAEAHQTPTVSTPSEQFTRYAADGIEILCGDLFDLTPERLGPVHAAYDRAALVALPPETRERYAAHLRTLLPVGAPMLLVTFDYPQQEVPGPPFSVPEQEVEQHFGRDFEITVLEEDDLLLEGAGSLPPRFAGLVTRAHERTHLLIRR